MELKFITDVEKCLGCSAITLTFSDNSGVSMSRGTFVELFDEPVIKRKSGYKWKGEKVRTFGSCNHCINHWGIDICKCGSGEPTMDCHKRPAQYLPSNRIYLINKKGTTEFYINNSNIQFLD